MFAVAPCCSLLQTGCSYSRSLTLTSLLGRTVAVTAKVNSEAYLFQKLTPLSLETRTLNRANWCSGNVSNKVALKSRPASLIWPDTEVKLTSGNTVRLRSKLFELM
jgi:hypothetical protein